jgi:hypothetical protein
MQRRAFTRAGLGALLAGLALLGDPTAARAQANVGANVQVLLPATAGAGVRPINLGVVTPGVTTSRTIGAATDSTAAGVGAFNFTGVNGNRDVQLTFDFPSVLTHSGSGNTMPISFNGSYGLHCFNRASGLHACTLFNPSPGGADPSVIVITPPAPPRNGVFRVYVGASVSPSAAVSPGVYQGTVTLTMVRL